MVLGRVLSAAIGLTPDGPHLSAFGLRPRFKRGLRQKLRPRLKRGLRYGFRPRVKRGHRPDPDGPHLSPFGLRPRFKRGLRHKLPFSLIRTLNSYWEFLTQFFWYFELKCLGLKSFHTLCYRIRAVLAQWVSQIGNRLRPRWKKASKFLPVEIFLYHRSIN